MSSVADSGIIRLVVAVQRPHREPEVSADVGSSDALAFATRAYPFDGLYVIREPVRVQTFLESHPFLSAVLLDAYLQIKCIFGHESVHALQVVSDPEAPGDDRLFVLIGTHLPAGDAVSALARLDETWWLGAIDRAESALSIDVEFL